MTSSQARDLAALWRARAGGLGPRPFLTYHDFETGERVELSYATMDNWVSKTANLIQDELLADPGSRFLLAAPPHWMTAVWALAPLACSGVVSPWGDAARARYAVSGPSDEQLAYARACRGERYALSLLPLGRPFAEVPEGFADYVAEVRAHGDRFGSLTPPNTDSPALTTASGDALTHAEVIERAEELAAREGYGPGARLLIAVDAGAGADSPAVSPAADAAPDLDLIAWLYAPLVAGGSVVLARGGSEADLARLAEVEKASRSNVER